MVPRYVPIQPVVHIAQNQPVTETERPSGNCGVGVVRPVPGSRSEQLNNRPKRPP